MLAWPATWLIGFAFAGAGMALTTFMKSWQDFEYIQLAIVPMFLFSATFFPVTAFHGVLRWVVEVTPLYRGVDADPGADHRGDHLRVAGLGGLPRSRWGSVGLVVATRRFDRLLLT